MPKLFEMITPVALENMLKFISKGEYENQLNKNFSSLCQPISAAENGRFRCRRPISAKNHFCRPIACSLFSKWLSTHHRERMNVSILLTLILLCFSLFYNRGSIVGAKTSEYLLEKSRIVTQVGTCLF